MTDKSTRRVYSAEELHRLRGTCSQPKLREAIEEHEDEDVELVKGKLCRLCTIDIIPQQACLAPRLYLASYLNF